MATERFILLPREGLHPSTNASSLLLASLPDASSTQPSVGAALPIGSGSPLRIVDTAERGGAQLIEMDTAVAMAVNNQPGLLRVMPLTTYEMPEPSSACATAHTRTPSSERSSAMHVAISCTPALAAA